MDKTAILEQLIQMSLALGQPEKDYVIYAEGNTSAKIDDKTFYVKASGTYLSTASAQTFVECDAAKVLELMDCGEIDNNGVKAHLGSAVVDGGKLLPSVETVLHAFCLSLPNVNFVGHTHPTAVNSILCSKNAKILAQGRLCPEEIVYCGIKPVFIPYCDPGVELARTLKAKVLQFIDEEGTTPKVILMQNHGFIALGKTPQDIEVITAMGVKIARMITGSMAFGGPDFLSDEIVQCVYNRPDEVYRLALMEKLAQGKL